MIKKWIEYYCCRTFKFVLDFINYFEYFINKGANINFIGDSHTFEYDQTNKLEVGE